MGTENMAHGYCISSQVLHILTGTAYSLYRVIFESVLNSTTFSFLGNRQHLAESDKIFVNFVLTY